jgi:hypothetical protein
MSDDLRRRRRLMPSGPRRSGDGNNNNNNFTPWIVTVLAALVVIVGGWFLGQALAHAFNGPERSTTVAQRQEPTPIAVTPLPSSSPAEATAPPSAQPTQTPTSAPTEKPTPVHTAAPTPQPTTAPSVAPTHTATQAPAASPTQTPAALPAPVRTSAPRKTEPVYRRPEPTPAAATTAPVVENSATGTVRAYIDALRRGDPQAAALYLGNGSPDESFIDSATRISSVSSTSNGDGSYKVEVDMKTSRGEYFETFVVASTSNGNRILDKTAIKP